MKQLYLIITFLPEPLYTVVMAMSALALVVIGTGILYRLMIKILDFEDMSQSHSCDDDDISHLHREYYVQDHTNGKKYTITTNPDGFVKSISGSGIYLEPEKPVRLVESGTSCLLQGQDGKLLKEFELTTQQ